MHNDTHTHTLHTYTRTHMLPWVNVMPCTIHMMHNDTQ